MTRKTMMARSLRALSCCAVAVLASCTSTERAEPDARLAATAADDFGVIVMAHGGTAQWNQSVEDSLGQLRSLYPVEVAFGMADAGSLEESVRKLESRGVSHVGVVRMFVSGESWYERTEQIFGIEEGAPPKPAEHHGAEHTGMPMGFWKIDTDLAFHLSDEGLAEAEEMDRVLLSRVRGLSSNPQSEVVVIIAHGPADDEENRRWIAEISERTELLRRELGVRDVRVFTLREDWEEKREGAEELIRDYVSSADAQGLTAIVVPFRVQGFGPYAEVLGGLNYAADQVGLTPHTQVTEWIRHQAEDLRREAEQHKLQLAGLR